jgi:hypothetical protein
VDQEYDEMIFYLVTTFVSTSQFYYMWFSSFFALVFSHIDEMIFYLKKANHIVSFEDGNGINVTDKLEMCTFAKEDIVQLFEKKASTRELVVSVVKPLVTDSDNAILMIPFTKDEFKETMFSMHLDKFPGPHGFNPRLYHHFWNL